MVIQIMFNKIKLLQRQGYSIIDISNKLSISRKTISKYYHMSIENYKKYLMAMSNKNKAFDKYKTDILIIYQNNNFKKLNMSAIYDYLEEKFGKLPYTEKTLRNYINFLVETNQLIFTEKMRIYEKVPELPFGKQMQLDFGVYKSDNGLKLYIFAAVLSSSRYKYISFQANPFKTIDIILHLLDSFDFFQGYTEQLVIDQDRTMVVSENKGDIIFTKDFQYFLDEMGIKMYVCRKNDPESKGKIENVIKYVKYNFLQPRSFNNLDEAKTSLQKWLNRRGNGKIHQTTKKIPADEIIIERKYLKPEINSIFRKNHLIGREERLVNEHSFISVNASQYSVPNRYKNKTVEIFITKNKLFVFDILSGQEVANHLLSLVPGKKKINRDHFRDKQKTLDELKLKVLELFPFEDWKTFMKYNFKKYVRYSRDQCMEVFKHLSNKEIDLEILEVSLIYCLKNKTYSISNLKDTYKYFSVFDNNNIHNLDKNTFFKTNFFQKIDIRKRDLELYKSIIGGGSNEIL
ncbi:MAG: transposase [Candidatus Lokiarchaeota archaeon]|nr:transposase [Candidatus Lokiarchaeota archaeon]